MSTASDRGTETAEEDIAADAFYSVLSNKRRRYAMHYLKQHPERISIQELAEQVAAWENEKNLDELTSQERKRVYISLYQSHLPTMDTEGLVKYDEDQGTVELAESARNRDLYLEIVPNESISWSTYYVGLTIANLCLLLLTWGNVRPFSLVPDLTWGFLILASYGISTFVQFYYDRQMRIGDDGPPPELKTKR